MTIEEVKEIIGLYKRFYNSLDIPHSDASELHINIEKTVDVEDIVDYVTNRSNIGVYPIKAFVIAYVYAIRTINHYKLDLKIENIINLLNEEDFLLGSDYFKTYKECPDVYSLIFRTLSFKDLKWMGGGWVPYTSHYWWLESTEDGNDYVLNKLTEGNLKELNPDFFLKSI